jgi:hypothetical protein
MLSRRRAKICTQCGCNYFVTRREAQSKNSSKLLGRLIYIAQGFYPLVTVPLGALRVMAIVALRAALWIGLPLAILYLASD